MSKPEERGYDAQVANLSADKARNKEIRRLRKEFNRKVQSNRQGVVIG